MDDTELKEENVQLLALIVKQTQWINAISQHYSIIGDQLTTISNSIESAQKDFANFFANIRKHADNIKAVNDDTS